MLWGKVRGCVVPLPPPPSPWHTFAFHPSFRYTRDEVVSRTMFNFTAEQEMQETFQIVSDVLSGKAIVSG